MTTPARLVCGLGLLVASGLGVEVHFEHASDGFFYRAGAGRGSAAAGSVPGDDSPTGVRLFTLRDRRQPAMVRATHGPFSTRQSVPVPMPLETVNITDPVHFHARAPQVSAHLVTTEVTQERPVLRVLVTEGRPAARSARPSPQLCVTVLVSRGRELLTAHCQPDTNGVCLAQVILPAAWWPRQRPLPDTLYTPLKKKKKPAKNQVSVSYLLSRSRSDGGEDCAAGEAGLPSQPVTLVGVVPLTQGREPTKMHSLGKHVRIAIPQGPLYPKTRVYVPVYVVPNEVEPVFGFTLRVRVRQGLQVVGAELASDRWNISVTSSKRRRAVTVTAYGAVRYVSPPPPTGPEDADGLYEAFTLLLRVDERPQVPQAGQVVWRIQYMKAPETLPSAEAGRGSRRKIVTQLSLQKDDTQIVLPMAKTSELMNTAMLTGEQVMEQLRVFMVTQAGDVADVTLKSSCRSTDESVLKVSSSCTSVYLDGSEARGSQNATVLVDYGTYQGSASFRVWVPEEPLDIEIPDAKLSQINDWRVRAPVSNKHPNELNSLLSLAAPFSEHAEMCELRYQQTSIEVYAKFVSRDDNSGRVSYVAGRKTSLKVTDLVRDHLRVANAQFATLRGNLLVGKAQGRTKVQLLSPITGAEVASREFRVAGDVVSVTSLEASIISGLQLVVSRRGTNEYAAVTSVTSRLTAQYQEGLLDMALRFSDGTRTPLSSVAAGDYYLEVESLEPRVVALAPQPPSSQPRVLAIGPGKGKLLKITLQMEQSCRQRRQQELASTYAHVEVQFAGQLPAEGIQNDASHLLDQPELYGSGGLRHGLQQVLEDARKAGKAPPSADSGLHRRRSSHQLQPLEIGMFVLLGVFCVVIAIFIVACFVYAGQVKRAHKSATDSRSRHSSHANAQDWVWLGRSSLEPAAARSSASQNQLAVSDMNANVDRFPPATAAAGAGRQLNITVNPHPRREHASSKSSQKSPVPKVDSRTFVKQRSPQPLYQNVGCGLPPEAAVSSDTGDDAEATPPPVPPHQGAAAASSGGRQSVASFVRPAPLQAPVRRANIVENPLLRGQEQEQAEPCRAAEPASELGLGMDYDELMRYFDGLKESTA